MTNNKLVIRRLPPSMSEDEFMSQIAPLPDHDYFCFFEANPNLGSHSFSRAYVNFLVADDTANFRDRFDNYIFLDRDGQEYPAVVEQSFWNKSPRGGPFFEKNYQISPTSESISKKYDEQAHQHEEKIPPTTPVNIEEDPDFLEFMEKHRNLKKRNQHSPIQTLENNLDELTKQSNSGLAGKKGNGKVAAPPSSSVNQKRVVRQNKRNKK